MWTRKNRARYDRSKLRYPSDLTDDEWGLVEPLIAPGKTGGGKRTVIMREVVNGLMYVLSTGCQWRAIPKDLPPKSTIHGYFDAGLRERMKAVAQVAPFRLSTAACPAQAGVT
jgi:transposase